MYDLEAEAESPTADLRSIRKELGWRQRHVAKLLGCSISYYSYIERGVLDRPDMVKKVRKLLARAKAKR